MGFHSIKSSVTLYSIIEQQTLEIEKLQNALISLIDINQRDERENFVKRFNDVNLSAIYAKRIDDLHVNIQTWNALHVGSITSGGRYKHVDYANLQTVGDLVKFGSKNLLTLRGFGQVCLKDLQRELKTLGVTLD
jgi:DNA-directed RNA polymerase alpha subunit